MSTPSTPSPSPPPPTPVVADTDVLAVWGLAGAIIGSAAVVLIVGWLVTRSSRLPFPSSVVTSLTTLAALALVGYAIGGEARPELAAIAGTAVGALAGATTTLLTRDDDYRPPPDTPNGPPGG